jgi:hypothetical protein
MTSTLFEDKPPPKTHSHHSWLHLLRHITHKSTGIQKQLKYQNNSETNKEIDHNKKGF